MAIKLKSCRFKIFKIVPLHVEVAVVYTLYGACIQTPVSILRDREGLVLVERVKCVLSGGVVYHIAQKFTFYYSEYGKITDMAGMVSLHVDST
jgi:hypothetical protein